MNEFLDQLHEKAQTMFTTLAPVAFVLIVFSLWSNVSNGNRSATMYLRAVVQVIVVVIVLSQFATWLEAGGRIVDSLVHDTLQAGLDKVAEKFMAMSASASDEAEGGFWHTIFNLSAEEMFKAFIVGVLWLVQFVAKVIVFLAYILQRVILDFAIAAAPLFVGFLCVRTLSLTGVRFILGTVGVLLWPLGWGFASLVTDALLEYMAREDFVSTSGMEELRTLVALAATALWIIFTTIAGPVVIQKMITGGVNAGAAFLSGGWSAASAATSGGAAVGASLATGGAAAPVAALGAVGAGAAVFGSSALSGSGGSGIPSIIGSAVKMGGSKGSKSSSSGQESSGYNAADPANDGKAAALIKASRRSSGS